MSPTAKNPSAKFATDKPTLSKLSKSTNNSVKTSDKASTIQRTLIDFKPISSNNHHSVTGANLLGTTSATQNPTTAVVSPKKLKAKFRSVPNFAKARSIVSPVVVKLETVIKSPDGEHVKSGQKRKPDENKTPPTKKKLPKRELTNID